MFTTIGFWCPRPGVKAHQFVWHNFFPQSLYCPLNVPLNKLRSISTWKRKCHINQLWEVLIHVTFYQITSDFNLPRSVWSYLWISKEKKFFFSNTECRLSPMLWLKPATGCRLCKSLFRSRFSDFISTTSLAIVIRYFFKSESMKL